MKTLKKALSIILGVAMILSCVAGMQISASAEDANPSAVALEVGTATVADGVVTVPVEVTSNPGFQALTLEVGYEEAVLDLVSAEKNAKFAGDLGDSAVVGPTDANPFKMMWAYALTTENVTATGTIATLTFNVVEGATAESTDITLNVTEAWDVAKDDVVATATAGTVTFACSHNWGAGVVTTKPTKDAVGVRTFTCSKCFDTKEEPIAVATKIETTFAHDIVLSSNIDVGFAFKKADTKVDEAVDVYGYAVKNTYVGAEVYGQSYQYFEKADFTDRATGSTPRKTVKYTGVSAKDMSNDIYIIIYFENADGTFTYIDETYRLTDYVDLAISNDAYDPTKSEKNAKFYTLLMDMLNYGAAAQAQFNYNTSDLPTDGYEDLIEQYATKTALEYSTVLNDAALEGATHKVTATLAAGSTISIISNIRLANNTKLTSTDGLEGYYVKCSYEGGERIIPSTEFYVESGDLKIKFSDFGTRARLKAVDICLYNAEGQPVSNTRTYSIASYVNSVAEAYDDIANPLRVLADNMLKFCNAAEAYFSM